MVTLLDSYSETNKNDSSTFGPARPLAIGQSFMTPNDGVNYNLDSCKFYLADGGSATGHLEARLYAHTGVFGTSSKPTGAPLATSDEYEVTPLTGSFVLVTFTFSGAQRVSMTANTAYCIEVNDKDVTSVISYGLDVSPADDGNAFYTFDLSSWTVETGWDGCFYVYGEAPAAGGQPYVSRVQQVAGMNSWSRQVNQARNRFPVPVIRRL